MEQLEVEVDSIRLDSFLASRCFPKIDLIWADLQGAELLAFKGWVSILKT